MPAPNHPQPSRLIVPGLLLFVLLSCGCRGRGEPVSNRVDQPGPADLPDEPCTAAPAFRESNTLYEDSAIRIIHVRIATNCLRTVALLPFYPEKPDKKAWALAASLSIDGTVFTNVGIRTRGNTSARNHKRQFKIALDCTTAWRDRSPAGKTPLPANRGRKYSGTGKFNLRASQNDPSLLREKLAAWIFARAGAPAPRVGFARLYINGEYWGLYLLTEQIDRDFVHARYGTIQGALYKGVRARAHFSPGSLDGFEYSNAPEARARQQLLDRFKTLEAATKLKDIASVFHLKNALAYLAAAVVTGHWDSYARLANNDYLYAHRDGRLRIIAWDMDNTFGSGVGWGFRTVDADICRFGSNSAHIRLFQPLLQDPRWHRYYRTLVGRLVKELYESGAAYRMIDRWKNLIRKAVYEDRRKDIDWRIADHDQANRVWESATELGPLLWNRSGFRGGNGALKAWLDTRSASIRGQLASLH